MAGRNVAIPSAKKLTRLKRERVSDAVFEVLRDSILTQVFEPGERLHVAAVAARLDVSLTPVKDAISRLAAEGLIVIRPRSGTYVAELRPEDVADTFQVREALKCRAAEEVVSRLTEKDLIRFRALIADLKKPVETEADRIAHERKNVEFHTLIVSLAGNRRLSQIYEGLNAHMTIARIHYSREGWMPRMERVREEHRQILEALEAHSLHGLIDALVRHIRRAADGLVEDLRRKKPAGG